METIIAVCITAGVTLVVCLINNYSQSNRIVAKVETSFKVAQAVTDTKIEELTREVREHNNFARRMPVVENEIKHIGDEIEHIEKDVSTLQGYHKQQ